jgi:hypothetical protein
MPMNISSVQLANGGHGRSSSSSGAHDAGRSSATRPNWQMPGRDLQAAALPSAVCLHKFRTTDVRCQHAVGAAVLGGAY